jgi:Methyltransferase domain/Glycosyl transferase family 2
VGASKLLIFTACYNERDNIRLLIEQIFEVAHDADILIVDDSSPDGTWDVILELQKTYPRLFAVRRPGKRGIGSAHKYALVYAMREGYDVLLTMDADFSHDPKSIPALLESGGSNVFVTGSRYCKGGRSDYSGYRNAVSRLGNFAARHLLNLRIQELTTYFRVFDVASLRRLPLRYVRSEGYSYGVQLVYYLRRHGVELREVPIHFVDRLHGTSKIPRLQILMSAFDLIRMAGTRVLKIGHELSPDISVADRCVSCGDRVLAMKFAGSRASPLGSEVERARPDVAAYNCTAVGGRSFPPVYTCLNCGLEQVPQSQVPPQLEQLYEDVEDSKYISNISARRRTFSKAMNSVEKWLPGHGRTMLEVGAYCGLFLQEAVKRGWDAEGVEPSRWAADYAKRVSGMKVHAGFLADNKQELKKSYDAVVSWDVLEHVRDPVAFLRECGSIMPESGMLFLSTLDTSSWYARLLGKRWPWLMDMHIQYFDVRSVADVLRRSGFELVASEPYTHFAKVSYMMQGAGRVLPHFLLPFVTKLSNIVPESWVVPVAFGDIKMYVARKLKAEHGRAFKGQEMEVG